MRHRDRLGTGDLLILLAVLRLGDQAYGVTIARFSVPEAGKMLTPQ